MIVAYAKTRTEEFFVNEIRRDLIRIGCKHVTMLNMHNHFEAAKLGKFDFIYVCGGNVSSILEKLKETGMDEFIVDQVKKGAIYAGESAGSIIAGKNIEITAEIDKSDANEIELKDLKGLGLIGIAVFPHFKDKFRKEVDDLRKKAKYPIVEITDFQAIICEDKRYSVVG